MDAVPAT